MIRKITAKHFRDFYCFSCLHSFRAKNNLESHKKVCENKDFCNIVMPSEGTKILEFNQNHKYEKSRFIFYAVVECLKEKIDGKK